MARKRMINPSFWTNRKIIRLSMLERLLFIGLISHADDEGRLWNDGLSLKANIFPTDNVTLDELGKCLERLASAELIEYTSEVIQLVGWNEHQTINRPQASRIPKIEKKQSNSEFTEQSVNSHGMFTPNLKEVNLKEVSLNEDKGVSDHSVNNSNSFFYQFFPSKFVDNLDFLEKWKEWVCFLHDKGDPLTPMSAKKQLDFLSTQEKPIAVIENSIMNNYKGLFALKEIKQNGNGNKGSVNSRANYKFDPEKYKQDLNELTERFG